MALLTVGLLLLVGTTVLAAPGAGQRGPMVKFEGVVESRPADTPVGAWVIGDQDVMVTEQTQLHEQIGPAEVGASVMVIAQQLGDGTLEALSLRVQQAAEVAEVYIKGAISELADEYLVVNGLQIEITEATEIEGLLEEGVFVKVRALSTATGYVALEIEVRGDTRTVVEFEGVVSKITDTLWVIGCCHQVVVNEETIIGEGVEVGVHVEVVALKLDDGTLVALSITFDPMTPGPNQTPRNPSATPGASQTPGPNQTPGGPNGTPSCTPSCTPQNPSQTPGPNQTPGGPNGTPSCTPQDPSETPGPIGTPQDPSETPGPIGTPQDPTETPGPIGTPQDPTETPQGPHQTPQGTCTPSCTPQNPSQTPKPTGTPGPKGAPGLISLLARLWQPWRGAK